MDPTGRPPVPVVRWVNIDGKEHRLGPDDVQLVLQPFDGYQVERAGTHAVALGSGAG